MTISAVGFRKRHTNVPAVNMAAGTELGRGFAVASVRRSDFGRFPEYPVFLYTVRIQVHTHTHVRQRKPIDGARTHTRRYLLLLLLLNQFFSFPSTTTFIQQPTFARWHVAARVLCVRAVHGKRPLLLCAPSTGNAPKPRRLKVWVAQ